MRRRPVDGTNACRHCGAPVRVAMMRSGRTIQLDMEPAAIGNLRIDRDGFAVFVPAEARWPKHPLFVPPEQRYVSHRATCGRNERTASAETRVFTDDVDRRLKVVR